MVAFNGLFDIEDDEIFSQSYIDIFYKALELNIDIINCSWSTTSIVDEASENAYEYLYEIDDSTKYNVLYPKSVETGYGLIDAEKAVDLALKYKAESEPDNEKESEHGNILRDLKLGWNLVGTSAEIVDFDIFNDVSIVWYFIDDTWMGYSANLDYAKSLRRQNKLATIIPKNSGLWVYKDET